MPLRAFCMPGRMFPALRGPLGAPRMLPCELIRSLPRTRWSAESADLTLAPPRPPLVAGRPPCRPLGPLGLSEMSVKGTRVTLGRDRLTHSLAHCRPCPCHMRQVSRKCLLPCWKMSRPPRRRWWTVPLIATWLLEPQSHPTTS
jgi:hypothetical protein